MPSIPRDAAQGRGIRQDPQFQRKIIGTCSSAAFHTSEQQIKQPSDRSECLPQVWGCTWALPPPWVTRRCRVIKGTMAVDSVYGSRYSPSQLSLLPSKQTLKPVSTSTTLPAKATNTGGLQGSLCLHTPRQGRSALPTPSEIAYAQRCPGAVIRVWALTSRHLPTQATKRVILNDFSPNHLLRRPLNSLAAGRAGAQAQSPTAVVHHLGLCISIQGTRTTTPSLSVNKASSEIPLQ